MSATLENNIMVDGGYDPHVWYSKSGDVFRRNIVWTTYRPAKMSPPPWGAAMDYNLVHDNGARGSTPATHLQEQSGRDESSLVADAQFIDPELGDYRVKQGSPALALGFANFPMDRFGVRKPELKAIARTPQLPPSFAKAPLPTARDAATVTWFGVRVRNILDQGEMSAFGLPGVTGVLVVDVPADSALAKAGLRRNDVILSTNGEKTADTASLIRQTSPSAAGNPLELAISRNQRELVVRFTPSP